MFARDIRCILLKMGRPLAVCEVDAQYRQQFGVCIIAGSYGHSSLFNLLEAIRDIVAVIQYNGVLSVTLQSHFSRKYNQLNKLFECTV